MRIVQFVRTVFRTQDLSAALILGLALAIVCWLGALPLSSRVQQATISRFHLQAPSYVNWCGLQFIPAMYNLENRFWLMESEEGSRPAKERGAIESGMVNHFPTRMLTSYDARLRLLSVRPNSEIFLESKYQDQGLTTRWRVERKPDDTFHLSQEPLN